MAVTIRELELRVREVSLPWDEGRALPTVDLILDGRDLQDWQRPLAPAAHREHEYVGHPVGADLRALLIGTWSGDGEDFDGRTALLGCTCRVIGCSPLLARVEVGDDTVTWSGFANYRGPGFAYDPVELEFDRTAYEKAIQAFESSVAGAGCEE